MKAEYVNPVYQAVQQVFKLMLNLDVMRSNQFNDKGKEVVVRIDIVGDITGYILFCFPQDTTLEIVKMMSGMEMKQLDAFVTSAIAEMSNIISGNAVTNLAKADYHCDILPPQILVAESLDLPSGSVLTIPLNTSVGSIQISMSLTENKN